MFELTPSQLLDYLEAKVNRYEKGHSTAFTVRIGPRLLVVYVSNLYFKMNDGSVRTTYVFSDGELAIEKEFMHDMRYEQIKGTEFIETLKEAASLLELILSHHQTEKLKNTVDRVRDIITKSSQ